MRVVTLPCGILVGLATPSRENRHARLALTCRAGRENFFVWHYMGGRTFIAEKPGAFPVFVATPMRKADLKRLGIKEQLSSVNLIKPGLIEISQTDLVLLHLLSEYDASLRSGA